MPTRDRRLDRARATARRLTSSVIADIREARVSAGLSQRDLGTAVGISASQVARFERGTLRDIGVEQLCRLSIGVGLDPSIRLYPGPDAVRDVAQLRLLERLRTRVATGIRWRVEVPLHGRTDARAWDAVADRHGCVDAIEAETRLRDLQAVERRVALKKRDDTTVVHVILLIADTRGNRLALAEGREGLRSDFPLDTRAALAGLGQGRCPGASAVIVL